MANKPANTSKESTVSETTAPAPAPAPTSAPAPATAASSGSVVSDASIDSGLAVEEAKKAAAQLEAQRLWAEKKELGGPLHSPELQKVIDGLTSSTGINGFKEMDIYLRGMAPGKMVEPEALGRMQVGLYRTLQTMMEDTSGEFNRIFGGLLRMFFEQSTGALGGRYVYRGQAWIPLNAEERDNFCSLLDMLMNLADKSTREQNKKTCNLKKALAGCSENALRNVTAFLGA